MPHLETPCTPGGVCPLFQCTGGALCATPGYRSSRPPGLRALIDAGMMLDYLKEARNSNGTFTRG